MRPFVIILAAAVTAACSPALAQTQKTDLDNLAGKRIAPEIGSTGYSIATEERPLTAHPRQRLRSARHYKVRH